MSQPRPASILTHFAALDDPRQHAKVLYPLVEILLLALAATVAGADDFVETTLWGEENQAFLRRFFPYENGIPSHDTLCDVFAAIDPGSFNTNRPKHRHTPIHGSRLIECGLGHRPGTSMRPGMPERWSRMCPRPGHTVCFGAGTPRRFPSGSTPAHKAATAAA